MQIGDVVHFEEGQFFNGAVQLGWVLDEPELAQVVARAFVFHGPRYHGAGTAEQDGIAAAYRLKDTAGFVCDLLRVMGAAASGQETNPYWLAVAGYGSGKSHLSVTIAALLADPDSATAAHILAQVGSADADLGADLGRRLTALGKPVLVLPLDGSKGFHLGAALSRVVLTRLAAAGVDADAIRALSPRFQTAEQFVERNFAFRTDALSAVLPGRDAATICAALRDQDEGVFDAVNAVYLEANGHPIPIEGQESAQDLMDALARIYCGEDGPFSQILILFDELGLYLEHAADHPERAGARVLQEIFQGVQNNHNKVQFVGFIQYELKAYLKRFSSSDLKELQRYITRFDAAEKCYLSTNLETLFAHLIHKDEAALNALWGRADPADQGRQTWQRLSAALPGFDRVAVWSDEGQFTRVILRGCWPLHPLAVWFLTRQHDLVQQRSALAFVKDVTERLRDQPALDGTRLRQIGAAGLVLDYMLPDLVAAERGGGGTVAETLQGLLTKYSAILDDPQRLVLAGIAVLDKAHIGRRSQPTVNALLCEATTLDETLVSATLSALSALGAAEWNPDLQRYELLSDGASRAQFEHWLRSQRQAMSADAIRQVFVSPEAADCPTGDIRPDFDRVHDIRTPDWIFSARHAHLGIIENLIRLAFDEWRQATLPTDAKGKLLYLFLHEDDDPLEADQRVAACFDLELRRCQLDQAPIWVILIADRQGRIADHLARLVILNGKVSSADQESFRRFIPDERERSRFVLKETVQDALMERRYRIAGFTEPPGDRLAETAGKIFSTIYPKTPPFPFDGFSTANGGGARDAVEVAKALMAGGVNYPWIQSKSTQLRNRIESVLNQSWQVLNANGEPGVPRAPLLKALIEEMEQAHERDPSCTLLATYRQLIGPPYGLNASSAAILLGLFLGLRHPQRAVEYAGQQVLPANWIAQVFSNRSGRHHFDEVTLGAATLRFFDGDVEAQWRVFLDEWEAVERYDTKLTYARKAKETLVVKPLPPTLALDYTRLHADADQAAVRIGEMQRVISKLQEEIERAVRSASVPHALQYGAKALELSRKLATEQLWPRSLEKEFVAFAEIAEELVASEVANWVPGRICHNPQQVNEFRRRTESEASWLTALGFVAQAQALTAQAQRSIARVEELQRHTLTLAKCEDYPRQPNPMKSTSVLQLRAEVDQGDELAASLQSIQALATAEKDAHISLIRRRQAQLKEAIAQRETELGRLDDLRLDSEESVREALATVERLRQVFAGTKHEGAMINDLAIVLNRLLADVQSWESGSVSVERLAEILLTLAKHQVADFRCWAEQGDIEPPPQWDLDAIYRSLVNERVAAASRRSADWLRPRTAGEGSIATLDLVACASLERELIEAPAYLADADRAEAIRLHEAVQQRQAQLLEKERFQQMAGWQRHFVEFSDVITLDRPTVEHLFSLLDSPPCPLRSEELSWQREVATRLTARLDELSLDDLVARIERLSPLMRLALFDRLSRLMTS